MGKENWDGLWIPSGRRDETKQPSQCLLNIFLSPCAHPTARRLSSGTLSSRARDIVCCGTKAPYSGEIIPTDNVCAVSIVRAGDSLLEAVRACCPGISVGKVCMIGGEAVSGVGLPATQGAPDDRSLLPPTTEK